MATLRIFLFGKFEMWSGDQAVGGFEARKAQELLCFLLLHRDHTHARESLANMLWEDRPSAHARKYLRQTLWQLQSVLETGTQPGANGRVLSVEDDWVSLNAGAQLWLDVQCFEQAYRLCQDTAGKELGAPQTAALCGAVELYRGDLLEGCYRDWCLFERERLQNMYLEMLDKLVGFCIAHQNYADGLRYGGQILRCDRARERTHRRLMLLHYLSGDRTAALRQYERCVAALAEELDVRPSRRTYLLAEQIRRDQLEGDPRARPSVRSADDPASVIFQDVLLRLKQTDSLLVAAHQQVRRDIQTIEYLIGQA